MPVYKSEEMDAVIARIKEKALRKQVVLGPVLTEAEVQAFEEPRGMTLPEAYRRFLLEVGNGFAWAGGYRALTFPPTDRKKAERLAAPFSFEHEWIWEAEESPDKAKIQLVLDGNLELADVGCCETYNLIITGKCRGEVWWFTDAGIQPCCQRQDFLGWFEKWLDCGDDVDCLEEYPYK